MKSFRSVLALCLLVVVGGCAPGGVKDSFVFSPESLQLRAKDPLVLSPEPLQLKQLQTRRFSGIGEVDVLAACSEVIQDLGFNLDESEIELGLLFASSSGTSIRAGRIVARILSSFSGGGVVGRYVDTNQQIRASIVTRPVSGKENEYMVRVTFQRLVWNGKGDLSKQEFVEDEEIYQEFFAGLSKAIFLEAHKI
jgi:hypothetical protein